MNPRNKGVCLACKFVRTSEVQEIREGRMGQRTVTLTVRTCAKDGEDINDHVRDGFCPLDVFFPDPEPVAVPAEASLAAFVAQEQPKAVVGLLEQAKAVPCLPCAKKAAAEAALVCSNCGGKHPADKCPIPPNYDGNYHLDSGGTEPCNC